MKARFFVLIAVVSLLAAVAFAPAQSRAQEEEACPPDKELCAKMIRFGKEAYIRGKYLDAKEYFRKAVKADPGSMKAWGFYDLAVVFALAEKVEKNADMVMPGVSTRKEVLPGTGVAPEAPAAPEPVEKKEEKKKMPGFVIIEDEGC